VIVAAAAVVLLLVAFLVTRGGGGGSGGGAAGLGTVTGVVPENGAFVHHVEVPAGSVLLLKVIPEGSFDTVLGIGAEFSTIEQYKNNFGYTAFGRGQVTINSDNSTLDGVDLGALKGGLFYDENLGFGPANADATVVPAPFAVALDIVVTALDGGTGNVTLQVDTRKFNGPPTTDDRGSFYVTLMNTAFQDFLGGAADMRDTRDFVKQSDFTDDSDFSRFSDSFSSLDGLPK
jgi:hypothetical protein